MATKTGRRVSESYWSLTFKPSRRTSLDYDLARIACAGSAAALRWRQHVEQLTRQGRIPAAQAGYEQSQQISRADI